MKRVFCLCSLALLAACVAGCGKDSPADSKVSAAEGADFDTLMRNGAAAVAQNDAGAAVAASARALELQPQSAEAHLLAGQAACLDKDYARASELFTSVINAKTLPAALRAKAYAGRGTVEFEQNDAELARISFLYALLLDPRNDAAYYYLGRIYGEVYHFNEAAIEHFQLFTRIKGAGPVVDKVKSSYIPDLQDIINKKAAGRPGAGGGDEAQAAKLIQEAQGLESKNKKSEALKKYEAARKAAPGSDVAALGYARLLAATAKSADMARKVIGAYCDAIALNPQKKERYVEAGRFAHKCDAELGIQEFRIQAVEIMNRAIAHHSTDKVSLDLLIAALRKTGNSKLSNAWDEYRKEIGSR